MQPEFRHSDPHGNAVNSIAKLSGHANSYAVLVWKRYFEVFTLHGIDLRGTMMIKRFEQFWGD